MPPLLSALIQFGIIDQTTAERMQRQLDPVQFRQWAEDVLGEAALLSMNAQQSRLISFLRNVEGSPTAAQINAFWLNESSVFGRDAFIDGVETVAGESSVIAAINARQFDAFNFINQSVIDWTRVYYASDRLIDHGSVPNLTITARQRFQATFEQWQSGTLAADGEGLPQLINAISVDPVFGPVRAEGIAVTETTRIFAQSTIQAELNNPETDGFIWLTAEDEVVCPICWPLNETFAPKSNVYFDHPNLGRITIPAHPRCRCEITPSTRNERSLR